MLRLDRMALALAILPLTAGASAQAAMLVGTASGVVVTSEAPGEGTSVVVGPSSQNFNDEIGTSAEAATDFGLNRARATSVAGFAAMAESGGDFTTMSVGGGSSAYAASYWGDSLVFTGGVGLFQIGFSTSLSGALNGAGGTVSYNGGTVDENYEGSASARWRLFWPDTLDLSTLDFADGSPADGMDLIGIYDGIDFIGQTVSDTDSGTSLFETVGISFSWTYGTPLDLGFLLEVWAADGGVADFFSTGTFGGFTLPAGTLLTAESGTQYNVTYLQAVQVPEPATAWLFAAGLLGLVGLVRRV